MEPTFAVTESVTAEPARARTLADLEAIDVPTRAHIAEALGYRRVQLAR
jgi:predicted ATPase with chaperone activity